MTGFLGRSALPDLHRRPYLSGAYFQFDGPQDLNNGGVAGLAAGMVRLVPGFIHAPVTISEFGSVVTTLSAGGNFQGLLYAADPASNMPTGAPLIQTGNLSTAATGQVKQAGLAKNVAPGLYWHGVQADNIVAAFCALSGATPFVGQMIGTPGTLFGINAGTGNITGLIRAGVFNAPPVLTGNFNNDGWSIDVQAVAAACFFRAA